MLKQIILNTPLWVWAILAFLMYRGISAAANREVPFNRIFIIPLVMLGLSLHGIASAFGISSDIALSWAGFAVVTTAWARRRPLDDKTVAYPGRGVIFRPGSWAPLMLMMGVFFTKYAVAVTLVMHPAYKQHAGFVVAICALYGVFNGLFIGNVWREMSLYRRTQSTSVKVTGKTFGKWGSQKF